MGYILPVRMAQYEEYHQRISNRSRDKYPIEKPFKTILETQYEEVKDTVPVSRKSDSTANASSKPNQQAIRSYERLTGKGMHFSSTV